MRDVESEKLFLFGRRLREGWLAFAMLRAQVISASKRYAESRKKSMFFAKSASLGYLVPEMCGIWYLKCADRGCPATCTFALSSVSV
jgi:hypothetical protein